MFGLLKFLGKERPKEAEPYHIITTKEVVYSPLSPSRFFEANHDEIHRGHITWEAAIQLGIGMLDQMATELNK